MLFCQYFAIWCSSITFPVCRSIATPQVAGIDQNVNTTWCSGALKSAVRVSPPVWLHAIWRRLMANGQTDGGDDQRPACTLIVGRSTVAAWSTWRGHYKFFNLRQVCLLPEGSAFNVASEPLLKHKRTLVTAILHIPPAYITVRAMQGLKPGIPSSEFRTLPLRHRDRHFTPILIVIGKCF